MRLFLWIAPVAFLAACGAPTVQSPTATASPEPAVATVFANGLLTIDAQKATRAVEQTRVVTDLTAAANPPTATATPTLQPSDTATITATPSGTPTATDAPTATSTATPKPVVASVPPPTSTSRPTATLRPECDPAYPTVCIPPSPPDLDCKDIPYRKFQVLPPDPHRFDSDHNGIGCEN